MTLTNYAPSSTAGAITRSPACASSDTETNRFPKPPTTADHKSSEALRAKIMTPCAATPSDGGDAMPATPNTHEIVRPLFLETARVVSEAIADAGVGHAWHQPSILDDQLVGDVAGHLARGGVWVVDAYLQADTTLECPRVESAVEYFAHFIASSDSDAHRQIRERGVLVASNGQARLTLMVQSRLAALAKRLPGEPPDRLVNVAGGTLSMALDEYLKTRIVEQSCTSTTSRGQSTATLGRYQPQPRTSFTKG